MKLGTTIVVRTSTAFNGSHEHPAIVNKAWSPTMVNCTVLPDCGAPFTMTSVRIVDGPEGLAVNETNVGWLA